MAEDNVELRMVQVDKIRPNPFQPRESFLKEDIQQLANSIKGLGLLQPITVRKKGETYQLISGERRWRAAQFAGMEQIPTIIKDVSDSDVVTTEWWRRGRPHLSVENQKSNMFR
jgi:ParB family chromosome partitioning protein